MTTKANDADDVLDFINSLPESTDKAGKSATEPGANGGKSDELLDFLDELAQHELTQTKSQPNLKFEPKKKKDESVDKVVAEKKDGGEPIEPSVVESGGKEEAEEGSGDKTSKQDGSGEVDDAARELDIDPIGSISSWWSKEGSNKVNSLWGSIASNAHQISEQTFQLASNTTNEINKQRQKYLSQDEALSSRLNSLFLNVSQQITQGLMDKDDELLNVLLIYDVNLNYLDKLINEQFNKVMNQVEGGIKVSVTNFNHTHKQESDRYVDLNMFYGKSIDGEKLGFANLESSIKDYVKITEESKEKTLHLEAIDDVNQSNIFISIQPISTGVESASAEQSQNDNGAIIIDPSNQNSFSFTIILKDITNNIIIVSKTQPFPLIWAKWLNGEELDSFKQENGEDIEGVDPTEWVHTWIKQGISLSFGVVAQQYVIRRMGF